jgi:hypothetical protein
LCFTPTICGSFKIFRNHFISDTHKTQNHSTYVSFTIFPLCH